MEQFTFFFSNKDIYSQWYPSTFIIDNIRFNCAEQWMMYSKAKLFKDKNTQQKILATKSPSKQKALGRTVKNFDETIWNKHARYFVYVGNLAKFTQNKELLDYLLSTKNTTLVEASPYDTIWGIGLSSSDKKAKDRTLWRGKNWLGETLTLLRDELLKGNYEIPLDKLIFTL